MSPTLARSWTFCRRSGIRLLIRKSTRNRALTAPNRRVNLTASPKPGLGPSPGPPDEHNVPTASAAPEEGGKADVPYAIPVPGKQGFVTSPFAPNSGYIDVHQFPPGTDVKDPFTGKVFRTP